MTEAFAKQIETEARQAMTELVAAAKLKKGDVLVVGCSSSEMVGGHIGKDSSIEAVRALYAGAAPVLAEKGIWLAAQCCEHLNRALIVERAAAEKFGLDEVNVIPQPKAGGSFGTTAYKRFEEPSQKKSWHLMVRDSGALFDFLRPRWGKGMGLTKKNKVPDSRTHFALMRVKRGRRKYREGSRLDQTEEESFGLWRKCGRRKASQSRSLNLAGGFAKAVDAGELQYAACSGNGSGISQGRQSADKARAVNAEELSEFRLRHAQFFIASELRLRHILKEEKKDRSQG